MKKQILISVFIGIILFLCFLCFLASLDYDFKISIKKEEVEVLATKTSSTKD